MIYFFTRIIKLGQSSESRVSCALLAVTIIVVLFSYLYAQHQLRKNVTGHINVTAEMLGEAPNTYLADGKADGLPEVKFKNPMGKGAISLNLGKRVRAGALEINIAPESGIVQNYYRIRVVELKDKSLGIRSSNLINSPWINIRPDNLTYRLPLSRSSVKQHFFLEIQYSGNVPGIKFDSIVLKPAGYSDFAVTAVLVGLFVFFAIVFPGILIFSTVSKLHFLPFVAGVFLSACGFMVFTLAIDKLTGLAWINPLLLVTLIILFIAVRKLRKQWLSTLRNLSSADHQSLNLLAGLSLLLICLLAFGHPSSLRNVDQGHITMDHGFFAFSAHDSVFQHANAKSLLEDNFHKYYGNYQLLAKPQDREIFPGLVYASLIRWMSYLPGDISYLYFPYAVFFLISNVLFLCVLFNWLQPLPNKIVYGALALVVTSPAFWVMSVVGWFKLTGAAVFLAGLYAIRKKPNWMGSWLLAGCLIGLSKNFHAGNILVAPIFFLWVLWIGYRHENLSWNRLLQFGGVMILAAIAFTLPWMIFVKKVWNVGSHTLFTYHFLAGQYDPGSLWGSIKLFFAEYTLADQFSFRLNALLTAFNPGWMTHILSEDLIISKDKLASWMKISSSYFLPAMIPAVVSVLLIGVMRWVVRPGNQCSESKKINNPWLGQFGWICLIGIIFIILASWAEYAITWHFPTLLLFGLFSAMVTCKFFRTETGYEILYLLAGLQCGMLAVYG